jgi:hypothetical protein
VQRVDEFAENVEGTSGLHVFVSWMVTASMKVQLGVPRQTVSGDGESATEQGNRFRTTSGISACQGSTGHLTHQARLARHVKTRFCHVPSDAQLVT